MHTLIMTLLISRPNALALTNPISNSDYFGKDFPDLKTKKKILLFSSTGIENLHTALMTPDAEQ